MLRHEILGGTNTDNAEQIHKSPQDAALPVVEEDPLLAPFADQLRDRRERLVSLTRRIREHEGSVAEFARSYETMGLRRGVGPDGRLGVIFTEWAPGAKRMALIGDFNEWDAFAHVCERRDFGKFHLFVPDCMPQVPRIAHDSRVKVSIETADGQHVTRIPAWIRAARQSAGAVAYDGVYWDPPASSKHTFVHPSPPKPKKLVIYEAHVGMSSQACSVASYLHFARDVVPYIAQMGYNCIQLMAVMEHAYYASFGYQVTNFYAASSRYGSPEDLKVLVDEAHRHGLVVLLDLVHSHASKNTADGLNKFDGSDHMYFHGGERGNHPLWDSRLFDYGNWEVLRFLLSNLCWWVDEFRFDGFRFDGVTSMLYHHHGAAVNFSGDYNEYFGDHVDNDAINYLSLANLMLHTLYPDIITIAEDVSGMPTLCRPVAKGGIGFDYRLGMAIPDKWIALLKSEPDERWRMGDIVHFLTYRRHLEKTVAYVESHDQALVGDKTIAFWLMDKHMYTSMSILQPAPPEVERGIALHKMMRLLTMSLGGEAYLTFMGNEFGHPEWIDFPREGNGQSFHHCRRRWDLAFDPLLRYQHLRKFEEEMNRVEDWLDSPSSYVIVKHEADKIIAFERAADFLLVFNFHPTKSFTDYAIGVSRPGTYQLVLDSDRKEFGGHDRLESDQRYFTEPPSTSGSNPDDRVNAFVRVYVPTRTVIVLRHQPVDE